ncbi:MAG: hypothetical protein P4M01_03885 [Acidobacteriota bacterium]|nr:hypothetical protein [Acidobacteriota bacterium]
MMRNAIATDNANGTNISAARESVAQALRRLGADPWHNVLLRWNTKAALLSALVRGGVFLLATLRSHHGGRNGAVLAEAFFGAACAGFFGTVTQAVRFATPQWQAEAVVAVAIPLVFQTGDYFFHAALGQTGLRAGMVSSALFTALSAAFNLYIMRRGTLLAGGEGQSFAQDLVSLPRLAFGFVVSGGKQAARMIGFPSRTRSNCAAKESQPGGVG